MQGMIFTINRTPFQDIQRLQDGRRVTSH
jgi:hypothetical protein